MSSSAPNGWFADGLLIFGSLEHGCTVSKGFILETPDLRGASVSIRNEYKRKIQLLINSVGLSESMQVQWTCNHDYRLPLTNYYQDTLDNCQDEYVKAIRNERFTRYWSRMLTRQLRREHLVVFIYTFSGSNTLKIILLKGSGQLSSSQ